MRMPLATMCHLSSPRTRRKRIFLHMALFRSGYVRLVTQCALGDTPFWLPASVDTWSYFRAYRSSLTKILWFVNLSRVKLKSHHNDNDMTPTRRWTISNGNYLRCVATLIQGKGPIWIRSCGAFGQLVSNIHLSISYRWWWGCLSSLDIKRLELDLCLSC
jgi:hypothetical protein